MLWVGKHSSGSDEEASGRGPAMMPPYGSVTRNEGIDGECRVGYKDGPGPAGPAQIGSHFHNQISENTP